MHGQICLCILIRLPDRGQTGRLCSHYVYAVSEIRIHRSNTRAYKFHDFVFHISVFKDRANNGQGNILRAYAWIGLSVQINGNYSWIGYIIGIPKKLFYQLAAAFSYRHGSQSTVTGVAVRT